MMMITDKTVEQVYDTCTRIGRKDILMRRTMNLVLRDFIGVGRRVTEKDAACISLRIIACCTEGCTLFDEMEIAALCNCVNDLLKQMKIDKLIMPDMEYGIETRFTDGDVTSTALLMDQLCSIMLDERKCA